MRISDWSSDVCSSDLLDAQRLQALGNPETLAKLDLVKVIREGKTALFAANLGLAAYQRRLAEQLGIEPGAELKAAADDARARGLPMHLIDRDVGVTFKRISARLGFFGRLRFVSGLLAGLFVDDEVRSQEHTPELQSLMRISYAVFCLKKKKKKD